MYSKLRNALGGLLLLVIAAGSWYLGRPPPAEQRRATDAPAGPGGYSLHGARFVGTDDTGRVTYSLSAARAEELPGRAGLVFSDVRVEYRPAEIVPWLLSAAEAVRAADGSYVDLRGSVKLASLPAEGEANVLIETGSLRFQPESFVARSEEPVRVTIGGSSLSAVGMEVHLKDDRLQLESSVHGQFVP